ncbi:transposase [Pseudomonas aeruginosa]|nr:transposase [Pseudomonas aeruginosa]
MTQTRRRFPESFKREAVDQVLAGTPLRHVAETLGIAESLLGKWKRQYEQQGDDAFPGNGKQRGESAELRRLRRQLAQVTMERDVLKRRSPSSRSPRSEVSRHRGVGWSLPRSTDVPVVAGVAQRFLCLATATTFGERDGESASEQGDPNHPPRGEWDLWSSPHQG